MRIVALTIAFFLLGCGSLLKVENGSEAPSANLPVEVEGNSEVPLGRVRAAIAAGDMSNDDSINKSVVALYYDLGFIEVKIRTKREAERILVVIKEGAKFSFGTLRVDGPDESALPKPNFKTGDTFSSSKTKDYVARIKQHYLAKDQNATVNPVIDVKREKGVAHVTIEIRIVKAPLVKAPLVKAPPAKTPLVKAPPAKTPLVKAPPAKTPPVKTPPTKTSPTKPAVENVCTPTPDIGRGESLVLRGQETVNLGRGPYRFSRICVKGQAKIQVCSQTKITITSSRPSVIGGKGIGGFRFMPATINIQTMSSSTLHVLFDNRANRLKVKLNASRLSLFNYSLTGNLKLFLTGNNAKKTTVNKGWKNTRSFPFCH